MDYLTAALFFAAGMLFGISAVLIVVCMMIDEGRRQTDEALRLARKTWPKEPILSGPTDPMDRPVVGKAGG